MGDPHALPPHFPDDPDGNYCVAYHVTFDRSHMHRWRDNITDYLFHPGMSVQEVIKNSSSHLDKSRECLHYFCMKNELVLTTKK